MKVLIILESIHHQNTKKIADAMAKVLKAKVMKPGKVKGKDIQKYDLIGFGSGIYAFRHHKNLFSLVGRLPEQKRKKAFVFSTSGMGGTKQHKEFVKKLREKGFRIVRQFGCKAFDTFGPFGFIGGLNKGRPNEHDLKAAETFAKKMRN